MHSTHSSRLSFSIPCALLGVLSVLAGCGGGGGGGAPPVQAKAILSGDLRVPALAVRTAARTFQVDAPMVPGEVVVWLEDPAAPPPDLSSQGLELLRAPGGPIAVYRARDSLGKPLAAMALRVEDSAEHATCAAAAALVSDAVVCASPNYLCRVALEPDDTHYDKQWHYPQINLPQAWDLTQGSNNVIVAVLDTGIVSRHPEFQGRLIAGFDFVSDPASARDGDGIDPDPEDPGDLATPQGSSFHGTHVTGTIGANGNNRQGVAGVDWNCRLMPVRVLGMNGGAVADIANGILFAAGLPNASNTVPPRRADIVNMSLGGPGNSPVLEQACNAAANAGALLIAAAGNDNSPNPNSPAAFASVLSVGAVDLVRSRAPYSNFHTSIEIWAPGGDMTADRNGDQFPDGVLSCMADDQGRHFFSFENGTSMAAPHVAGVAALIKAANPALSAAQIRQILLNTTVPGNNLPNGGRMVDALGAVQAATGAPPTQPLLVATPAAFDFGPTLTQTEIGLANRGAGTLTFETASLQPDAPWFSGTLFNAPPSSGISHDRLEVQVDRTGLANGVHQTRLLLVFRDAQNQPVQIGIDFRLQVGDTPPNRDDIFVLLVDLVTFETRAQAVTNAATNFAFTLTGIDAGTYLLVAGTDRDNNGFIGEEGELFGAFPSLDTPLALQVAASQRISGLSFSLQELIVIQAERGGRFPLPIAIRRLP